MTKLEFAAALLLPFVGALHSYAINYGFKGKDKWESLSKASDVWIILMAISCVYAVWMDFGPMVER